MTKLDKPPSLDYKLFEKVIAYKSMTNVTYLNTIIDLVKPEYFEDINISNYFEIVKNFYSKRNQLPTNTEVKTYLTNDILRKNFKKLVESFKDLDSKGNDEELYENTERFLKERASFCILADIGENLEHKTQNPAEVLASFEEVVGISLQTDRGLELFSDTERLIDDILSEEACILTGWKWLDDALGGGFRKNGKALYAFAGQANIGKSIFLGNIAANIAEQNLSVLVITLEMSEYMYAQRISSKITKIPMRDFKEEVHSLRHALGECKKEFPEGRIFIKEFPPSTVTPSQLKAFIKKLVDSGIKLDAIIIDYLGLLHSPMGSNSYERLKYICEQVRAMSYPQFFGCPVISACQLSKSGYGTDNPGMENLAESMGIAATCDSLTSIFQSDEDLELGIIRLGKMKNRFGPRGMVQTMRIDYPTLSIFQTDEDEEPMGDEELSLLERLELRD